MSHFEVEFALKHSQIADITKAWVNGTSIEEIARDYFKGGENQTKALTAACKAIYKTLVNNGTWGISALSRLSGIDFDQLSEPEKRQINLIPAMIYHGVRSEEGVLLRMNSVPRSIAESLGSIMKLTSSKEASTIQDARSFLKQSNNTVWEQARPQASSLSGEEYKKKFGKYFQEKKGEHKTYRRKLEQAIIKPLKVESYEHLLGQSITSEPSEVLIKKDLKAYLFEKSLINSGTSRLW